MGTENGELKSQKEVQDGIHQEEAPEKNVEAQVRQAHEGAAPQEQVSPRGCHRDPGSKDPGLSVFDYPTV